MSLVSQLSTAFTRVATEFKSVRAALYNKGDAYPLATVGGTATYLRIATLNGNGATGGAQVNLVLGGGGDYGNITRVTYFIQMGQRGDNLVNLRVRAIGSTLLSAASQPRFFTRQISTYVFELWVLRPAYDGNWSMVLQGIQSAVMNMDSATTTAPTSPALGAEVLPTELTDKAYVDPLLNNKADLSSGIILGAQLPPRLGNGSSGNTIPNISSPNTAFASGFYNVSPVGGGSPTTSPGNLLVLNSGGQITQMYMLIGATSALWERSSTDGGSTWSTWYKVGGNTLSEILSLYGNYAGNVITGLPVGHAYDQLAQIADLASSQAASVWSVANDKQVRVATSGFSLNPQTLYAGQVVDGITLAGGDLVLIYGNQDSKVNGIWMASTSSAVAVGRYNTTGYSQNLWGDVRVLEGSANAGKRFRLLNWTPSLTPGTDGMTWVQLDQSTNNVHRVWQPLPALVAGTWSGSIYHGQNSYLPCLVNFMLMPAYTGGTGYQPAEPLDWRPVDANNLQVRADVAIAANILTIEMGFPNG